MVIERLGYRVPRATQEAFLAADAAIWTVALATRPGFLGKEVWRPAEDPDRLELIIRWESRAAWKAVPADLLAETGARFRAAFPGEAAFLGCTEFEVTQ